MKDEIIVTVVSGLILSLIIFFVKTLRKEYVCAEDWVKGTVGFVGALSIFGYSVYSATVSYMNGESYVLDVVIAIVFAISMTVLFATVYACFDKVCKALQKLLENRK